MFILLLMEGLGLSVANDASLATILAHLALEGLQVQLDPGSEKPLLVFLFS